MLQAVPNVFVSSESSLCALPARTLSGGGYRHLKVPLLLLSAVSLSSGSTRAHAASNSIPGLIRVTGSSDLSFVSPESLLRDSSQSVSSALSREAATTGVQLSLGINYDVLPQNFDRTVSLCRSYCSGETRLSTGCVCLFSTNISEYGFHDLERVSSSDCIGQQLANPAAAYLRHYYPSDSFSDLCYDRHLYPFLKNTVQDFDSSLLSNDEAQKLYSSLFSQPELGVLEINLWGQLLSAIMSLLLMFVGNSEARFWYGFGAFLFLMFLNHASYGADTYETGLNFVLLLLSYDVRGDRNVTNRYLHLIPIVRVFLSYFINTFMMSRLEFLTFSLVAYEFGCRWYSIMNDFGGKAKSYNTFAYFLSFYNLRSNLLSSTLINGVLGRFIHPIASAFGGVPGCLMMGHVGNVSRTISLSFLRNLMISLSYETNHFARLVTIYIVDNAKLLDATLTIVIYFLINLTVITLIISNVNYSKGIVKKLNYVEFYVVGLHAVLADLFSTITYVRLTYSQLFWTLSRRGAIVVWIIGCNLEIAVIWIIAELIYFTEELNIRLSVRHSFEARTYGISKSQLDAIESECVLFTSTSGGQTARSSGRFVRNCLELASHCLLAGKGTEFSLDDGSVRKVYMTEIVGEITNPSCIQDQIVRYYLNGMSTGRCIPTASDAEINRVSQLVVHFPQDGARIAITSNFSIEHDCIFYDIMTKPGDSSCPVYGLVDGDLRYLGLHSQGNSDDTGRAVCIREKMSPKRSCTHTEGQVFSHYEPTHRVPNEKHGIGYRTKRSALLSEVCSKLVGTLAELGKCIKSLDAEGINAHFDSLSDVIKESCTDGKASSVNRETKNFSIQAFGVEKFSGTLARIVKMLETLGVSPDEVSSVRTLWPATMDKPDLFVNFFKGVVDAIKAEKRDVENMATSYLYCRYQASLTPFFFDSEFQSIIHDVIQEANQVSIAPDFYDYAQFHACLIR